MRGDCCGERALRRLAPRATERVSLLFQCSAQRGVLRCENVLVRARPSQLIAERSGLDRRLRTSSLRCARHRDAIRRHDVKDVRGSESNCEHDSRKM